MGKVRERILLLGGQPLPARYRDHPLSGNWQGYRDIHIEPDWLLIYRIVGDELRLVRTAPMPICSTSDVTRERAAARKPYWRGSGSRRLARAGMT
jgi:mRNA interferase YafQ